MTDDAKDVLKIALFPIFLGNTHASRSLAARLFYRAGVSSLICDKKRSAFDLFAMSYRFYPLYKSLDDALLLEQLFSLAKKHSERTLLLVPTTEEYSSATDRLAQQLETQFIITDINSLFDCPPIKDIMS
jgi:hypothetical protein